MKKLERNLGLLSLCAIACGAMLSGLFVLPGHAAKIGGPAVYLAFMLAGLLFLPAALSKAEMATALPEAGGDYIFIDRAMGPLISTITGIGTWLALMLKSAFALVGLSAYLFLIVDFPVSYLKYFACGVGALLIVINCVGVKKTGQLQTGLVATSLIVLVIFVERGAIEVNSDFYQPLFTKGWFGFISATAFVFVSYAGVTKVASAAEEVVDPGTNLPWGMLLSLTIMTIFYTAVVFVFTGVVPGHEIAEGIYKNAPIAQAAFYFAGRTGEIIISFIAVLALASMANAGLLASSRYPLAMSRYNQLPKYFSQIHSRFKTPVMSILPTGGAILFAIIFLPVIQLAKLASAFLLLVFALVNLSLIIFREGDIEWYRPKFRSPLYPYVQLFGIISSIALIGFMGWLTIAGSVILLLIGLLWYFTYVRNRVDRKGVIYKSIQSKSRELEMFDEFSRRMEPGEQSIVVPFFELEEEDILFMERRIRLAAALCDSEECLDVVHFFEIPDQTFLPKFEPDESVVKKIDERINLLSNRLNQTIKFDQILTSHTHEALRSYVEAEKPYWLVYRWITPSPWKFLVGKSRWWFEDFPTNVVFFNDNGAVTFEDILVITEPGPYDGEVVYTADHIAQHYDGQITFLNPVASTEKARTFVTSYHDELRQLPDSPTDVAAIEADRWVEEVLDWSKGADLLVMGGLTDETFPGFPGRELGEQIAEQASCSVIRVRSNLLSSKSVMPSRASGRVGLDDGLLHSTPFESVNVASKQELFRRIADDFSGQDDGSDKIREALWQRERQKNTYITQGIGFPRGILENLDETRLKVYGLESAITYTTNDKQVDFCVVTVGPSKDRQVHLEITGEMSRRFVNSDLKSKLNKHSSPEELIADILNTQ